jgi:hypothetical protein
MVPPTRPSRRCAITWCGERAETRRPPTAHLGPLLARAAAPAARAEMSLGPRAWPAARAASRWLTPGLAGFLTTPTARIGTPRTHAEPRRPFAACCGDYRSVPGDVRYVRRGPAYGPCLLPHLVPAVTCPNIPRDAVDSLSYFMVEFCIAHRCTLCEQLAEALGNESTVDTRHGAGAECGPGFKALVSPYEKETK